MGSLIAYSGIATKVKAMERWRIKMSSSREMAALETVPDAVQYLRAFLPYREIFRTGGGPKGSAQEASSSI